LRQTRESFSLVSSKQGKINDEGVKKIVSESVACNLGNPLYDYSFRMAL
jgi:hypothetical protein